MQTDKARELIDLGGLVPTARPSVFRAVGSKGLRSYLSRPATCGCPAGRRGKATPCCHSLATRIVVAGGKSA